jgi:xylulose-5-phosphate/fructose-6-phosphate phosphoketolase
MWGVTSATAASPLSDRELGLLDAYWRAANYLSVGQIYLLDNALLREPWRPSMSSRACSASGGRRLG